LHGFIHEKLQEKNHVNIFLFEVMKILNACKIQDIFLYILEKINIIF
jgi:hypothetical protein